jgi:hypothetical protein
MVLIDTGRGQEDQGQKREGATQTFKKKSNETKRGGTKLPKKSPWYEFFFRLGGILFQYD